MASLTAHEMGLIFEFEKRFKPGELNEDQASPLYLIRWIQARNYNLDKAEEMLRKTLKWRKEHDIDNISTWEPPSEFNAELFADHIGYDYDNSPISVIHMGRMDFRKMADSGQQGLYLRYVEYLIERGEANQKGLRQRNGDPVTRAVLIVDMEGFSYKCLASKPVVNLILQLVSSMEANHPELLKALYFINAGLLFPMLMSLAKPFLHPATRDKMVIYNEPSKWLPILQQNIPLSVLPPSWGGTNTAAEFKKDVVVLSEDPSESDFDPDLLTVVIPAGDKIVLIFEVEKANSTITWAFKTNKSEIDFKIQSVDDANKVYVDIRKVESHLNIIEGAVILEFVGDYIFTFDNGSSKNEDGSQKLKYRIDIRAPAGVKQLTFD